MFTIDVFSFCFTVVGIVAGLIFCGWALMGGIDRRRSTARAMRRT